MANRFNQQDLFVISLLLQDQCSLSTFRMNIHAALNAYKVEWADVRRMECKPFLKVSMSNSNTSLQLKKRELNIAEISCWSFQVFPSAEKNQTFCLIIPLYFKNQKTTKVLSSILRTDEFEDKELFILYFGHLQMKWT